MADPDGGSGGSLEPPLPPPPTPPHPRVFINVGYEGHNIIVNVSKRLKPLFLDPYFLIL